MIKDWQGEHEQTIADVSKPSITPSKFVTLCFAYSKPHFIDLSAHIIFHFTLQSM